MQIRPDVFWIDTRSSNVYFCRDADGWTLIDTGMPGAAGRILSALEGLGGSPAGLKRIVLTHADLDHAGSVAELQRRSGAEVWAGGLTADYLAMGQSPSHLPGPIQFLADRFVRYPPFPRGQVRLFSDGQSLPVLGGLVALATPGHTPDHFSLRAPEAGIVFAGDALNTRWDRLRSTPRWITADRPAADRSALRLLDLDPFVIAAGHGKPLVIEAAETRAQVFGKLRQRIGK